MTLQPRLTLRERKKNLFYIHIPVSEREKFCLSASTHTRTHNKKRLSREFSNFASEELVSATLEYFFAESSFPHKNKRAPFFKKWKHLPLFPLPRSVVAAPILNGVNETPRANLKRC